MKQNKDNLVYIKHIRDAVEKISDYASHKSYDNFINSEWDQAAVMRYFEIIGEAVSHIDQEFKETYPKIKWRDMSDFRNFLIHDYMDIDLTIVWNVMTKDIPELREEINNILLSL